MPKSLLRIVCMIAICAPAGFAGVNVTSPANGATVSGSVNYSATSSSSCSKGVASMGIYSAPGVLAYVVNGSSLNTSLSLGTGTHYTTVEEWDNCGGASTSAITVTVTSGGGKTFSNIQRSGGWSGYGQRSPNFTDCSPSPCENVVFTMTEGVKSPSMSGSSSAYYLAGSQAYGDSLWNNHLIGDLSSQGVPDSGHTLVQTLHNFTYDVYFFLNNNSASQALEFDINQFFNGMGFIWGHECRLAGGNMWDVWDNLNSRWVSTGVSCNPTPNAWNHLTIQVERTSSNQLLYQSITLNGVTHTLNEYYSHGSAPGSWWGVTINYQMDGNISQTPYTVYLDNLNFTYQ